MITKKRRFVDDFDGKYRKGIKRRRRQHLEKEVVNVF
jgi:hypothetical protein